MGELLGIEKFKFGIFVFVCYMIRGILFNLDMNFCIYEIVIIRFFIVVVYVKLFCDDVCNVLVYGEYVL